jgi:magnesium transporter
VSTSTAEPTLSVDDILSALGQRSFVVYLVITLILLSFLIHYSNTKYGKEYILIDLSIASIIGGYTVLSIKALSSLLKLEFYRMLTHWITYLMGLVLLVTCILQVRYLNRALSLYSTFNLGSTQ